MKKLIYVLMAILAVFAVGCKKQEEAKKVEKAAPVTTLRVVGVNHPFTEAMEQLIPEFEKTTGIKVQLEKYGEDQLTQKLTTEFTAGSSNIDVFMTRPLQEARLMKKNGWYQDLASYVGKNPAFDFEDFTKSSRGAVVLDGFVTAVPLVTEAQVLYYRKDLLAAKGITPPTTMEELAAAAEKLTDRKNEMAGFMSRGQRSPLITQFSSFLYSFGGDFFNKDTMTATMNTPEAMKAVAMYGMLLNKYGPDGVLNMSWPQGVAIFGQGKAAMYTEASSLYANLLDPAKSAVADKTGVAKFPAGPAGANMYNVTTWAFAINNTSKSKDAAWQFIEFMSSKKAITYIQGERAVQSARNSVWASEEGTKNFPADWKKAVAESADGVPYDRPVIVAVGQARDILGEAIVFAIEGKDFKKPLEEANKKFQELLDKEK